MTESARTNISLKCELIPFFKNYYYVIYHADSAKVPIRGAGDGMETKKSPVVLEVNTETMPRGPSALPLLKVASPKHSPKCSHPAPTAAPQPLGVLHLGKVSREACTEVEAVRILVPRAAISRTSRAGPVEGKGEAGQQSEEQGCPPLPVVEDWKGQMEKLQNSERRLLQDKEGLSNQLRVQTEVRPKKLITVVIVFFIMFEWKNETPVFLYLTLQ